MTLDRYLNEHPWIRAAGITVFSIAAASLLIGYGLNATALPEARQAQAEAEQQRDAARAQLAVLRRETDLERDQLATQIRLLREEVARLRARLDSSGMQPTSVNAGSSTSTSPTPATTNRPPRDGRPGGQGRAGEVDPPPRPSPRPSPTPAPKPTPSPAPGEVCVPVIGICIDQP